MNDFIPITIDQQPHKAPHSPMTGAELKALASVAGEYDLFFETAGPADDVLVPDSTAFSFKPGSQFYTIARTINPGAI